MTRPPTALAATAALAVLLLAGCGSGDADVTPAASSEPSEVAEVDAPAEVTEPSEPSRSSDEPVPEVLRFQATTVTGDPFDGASLAGRPVVLWFWAPWCSVCASQVPEVTALARTHGEDVAFVGVGGLDTDEGAIAAFASDLSGLTNLSDTEGALYQRFGIAEQSSFVVLDADGEEVLRTGYADDDALAGAVEDVAG